MKIKSILCGLFAAAAVIACQEEPLVTPALEVTPESASVDATGGTVEISVTSNVDWTVDLSEDWIKSDPQSGKASDKAVKVVVTVDPNDGEDSCRYCLIRDSHRQGDHQAGCQGGRSGTSCHRHFC